MPRDGSEKAAAFLRLYAAHGAGLSIAAFCRKFKQSQSSYWYWRKNLPTFAERLDALRQSHVGHQKALEGEVEIPELTPEQSAFIKHYQESHEKGYALAAVGASPSDLTDWLSNPIFAREFKEVEDWIQIRVEDALIRESKEGSIQHAKVYLQAVDPRRYSAKVAHVHKLQLPAGGNDPKAIGAHWRDRLLASRLKEDGQEIVDAVVVSESVQ